MSMDRNDWVLDKLAIEPSDRVLELGCGYGHMVSLVCERLTIGSMVALDRSRKMVQAAEKLNEAHIASGRARFVHSFIHHAELGPGTYHKIFAVNVNVFWMKAEQELAMIKRLLDPEGKLFLFNQPPVMGDIQRIADKTKENLLREGFTIQTFEVGNAASKPIVCAIACKNLEGIE